MLETDTKSCRWIPSSPTGLGKPKGCMVFIPIETNSERSNPRKFAAKTMDNKQERIKHS